MIDFNKVEIEEFWIEEEEQEELRGEENTENSPEISPETQDDSKFDTNSSKSPVPVAVTSANQQLSVEAKRFECLPVVPVDCSSKETNAHISADTSCPPRGNCSNSVVTCATETDDCHPDNVQVKIAVANEKKPVSNFSVTECSNHHFTPSILSRLLKSTVAGDAILESGNLGPLTSESRKELVAIIADYHHQKGLQATERTLDEYATSITALFKSESKVYYSKFLFQCDN